MTVGPVRRLRRVLGDHALAAGARLGGGLPDRLLGAVVRGGVRTAGLALRPVLRANLRLVFGPERRLDQIERDFFDRAAEWARYTALTFHRGFARSGFAEEGGVLHDTFAHRAGDPRRGHSLRRGASLADAVRAARSLARRHPRVSALGPVRHRGDVAADGLSAHWLTLGRMKGSRGMNRLARAPEREALGCMKRRS